MALFYTACSYILPQYFVIYIIFLNYFLFRVYSPNTDLLLLLDTIVVFVEIILEDISLEFSFSISIFFFSKAIIFKSH